MFFRLKKSIFRHVFNYYRWGWQCCLSIRFSLRHAGHTISQVYSRTIASAQLAKKLECSYTTDINALVESDFALIAVKDDAIKEIEKYIDFNKIHTSGSKHLDCLRN